MTRSLEWSDLRYFLEVARTGRLLAAGRKLGVRHTTVARRLDALEQSLDAKLFHRTTRGWRLTALGERVRSSAEGMEEHAIRVAARAREERGELRGRVRVAMPESWAHSFFAPALPQLRAEYPNIDVEILTGNALVDLTRGEADLGLRTPRPRQRELAAVLLCEGGFGVFATRELAKKHRAAFASHPPNGAGVPLGVYPPEYDFLQNAPWFRAFMASARVELTTGSTLTLLAAARSGAVAAVMPRFVGRNEPGLVEVSRSHISWQQVWLVTHPEVRRDARVAAVAAFLRKAAKAVDER